MKFNITHTILKSGKFGSIKNCNNVDGSGIEVKVIQMGPIIQQTQVMCDNCSGTGKIFDKNLYKA